MVNKGRMWTMTELLVGEDAWSRKIGTLAGCAGGSMVRFGEMLESETRDVLVFGPDAAYVVQLKSIKRLGVLAGLRALVGRLRAWARSISGGGRTSSRSASRMASRGFSTRRASVFRPPSSPSGRAASRPKCRSSWTHPSLPQAPSSRMWAGGLAPARPRREPIPPVITTHIVLSWLCTSVLVVHAMRRPEAAWLSVDRSRAGWLGHVIPAGVFGLAVRRYRRSRDRRHLRCRLLSHKNYT